MAKISGLSSCGLTVLRIVTGAIFLAHGWQKIGTYGFHGVAESFAKIGIPLPMAAAVIVTLVELLGGIALIAGLGTRLAGLLIAIDMVGAIYFVHGRNGFFLAHNGYEFALALLGASVALALSGGGALALDSLI